MSANLDELESQHLPKKDVATEDPVVKTEMDRFLNRYVPQYRMTVATQDLQLLIEAARKHR